MAMSMLMSTLLNSATLASASTSAFCMQKKFLEQLRHQFSFSSTFLTKASFFSLFSTPKHFSSRPAITATAETTTRVTADDFSGSAGFLGIGIMGSPMVENLIQAGHDVTVWNRTKSECDPLTSLGAKFRSTPEEVATSCDITFSMLANSESALDVACGKHRAASGMSPGKGYVDVSTVDSTRSKLVSSHIKAIGALFLEAPVLGSKKPAEDGQLIFLIYDGLIC